MEKVFSSVPKKFYNESLRYIIIGDSNVIPPQDSSVFYRNTIYISPYFIGTQHPIATLQKILVHEIGHAFVSGWKENLFYDNGIIEDFVKFKETIKKVIPEFPQSIIYAKKFDENYRKKVEKFISSYGEGEIMSRLFPIMRSPYMLLSPNEFVAYNFEEFFLGEEEKVKKCSSKLYDLIKKNL
ncbi:MAG: hypothetical protein QXO70_04230 [Candidatus Pacearchaeota archaeon]